MTRRLFQLKGRQLQALEVAKAEQVEGASALPVESEMAQLGPPLERMVVRTARRRDQLPMGSYRRHRSQGTSILVVEGDLCLSARSTQALDMS